MKRLTWAGVLTTLALMAAPSVASAQIDQLIGFNAGGFFPRTESSRSSGDVLLTNLDTFSLDPAGPGDDIGRGLEAWRGGQFGGEYLLGLGDWVEAGVGISYYQRELPSQYRYQVGTADLDPGLNFASNKLDLGGHSFVGTFHVRF